MAVGNYVRIVRCCLKKNEIPMCKCRLRPAVDTAVDVESIELRVTVVYRECRCC